MLLEDFQDPDGAINLVAAAQMCALCCMVYEDDEDAIRALVQPEGELLYFHGTRETWTPAIAVVRSGANRYFIICEGTISFTQGFIQASPLNQLSPEPDEGVTDASSYGIFYWQVYQQLRELVAPFVPFTDPNLQLYLSGHSMGGAVAQVAAFEFARYFSRDRVQLMTIGAPKAAHGPFTDRQPAIHWRVESSSDPVTTYPVQNAQWLINMVTFRVFRGLFPDGWRHYGRAEILTRSGTDDGWAPPRLPLEPGLALDELGQHFLGNYLARIKLRAEVLYVD